MYIVQEIQTTGSNVSLLPAEVYPTREAAESAYFFKCGAAVVSSVPVHTVMVFTEEGFPVKELIKCFEHTA